MTNGTTRILSIDGGGIKGVLPAAFLAEIEAVTGKQVVDYFDIIAGTSTGGILALGLGLGIPANELLQFYVNKGPDIFYQDLPQYSSLNRVRGYVDRNLRRFRHIFTVKYETDRLRDALTEAFGGRILGDSQTRLVIPAYDSLRQEVYVFKTPHHPRLQSDWKRQAVEVALATAAAPTYFPRHQMVNGTELIDGGVWANNPVGLAVVEAVGVLNRNREHIKVLSLGCTEETCLTSARAGIKDLAPKAKDLLFQGQSKGAIGTAKILIGHSDMAPKFFRYSPVADRGVYSLDSVKMVEELRSLGASASREALPLMNNVFLDLPREPFYPLYPESE